MKLHFSAELLPLRYQTSPIFPHSSAPPLTVLWRSTPPEQCYLFTWGSVWIFATAFMLCFPYVFHEVLLCALCAFIFYSFFFIYIFMTGLFMAVTQVLHCLLCCVLSYLLSQHALCARAMARVRIIIFSHASWRAYQMDGISGKGRSRKKSPSYEQLPGVSWPSFRCTL